MIYGREHETELKTKFKAEMHGTKPEDWLYNGAKSPHADLGFLTRSAYY
ncbi:hypothetical protein [Puia sp.]|jgi:hypothetical protein